MLFHEFIPCIHLASLRSDPKLDDTLREKFESKSLTNSIPVEEEYNLIVGFRAKEEFRTIKDKPHRGIFLEMIGGSISLRYFEKMKIVTHFINGAFTERQEFELINTCIEEREAFFNIYINSLGGTNVN